MDASDSRHGAAGGPTVIVGGGVVGASIAFHLAERGERDVVILERGLVGEGATAAATGGVRHQFSTAINVELAVRSTPLWAAFAERTGAELAFRRRGYLFLVADDDAWASAQAAVALQRRLGTPSRTVRPDEVDALFPGVRTDDLRGATFNPDDGWLEPAAAVAGLVAAARRRGVTVRQHTTFLGLRRAPDGRVTGVHTDDPGSPTLPAARVVVAAGPQSRAVARACGVDLPVTPHPRQVFAATRAAPFPDGLPLTVDLATGAYVHPTGPHAASVGGSDRAAAPGEDTRVDWGRVEHLAAALDHRFPGLDDLEVGRGWAGLREMTPDDHAIVGPITEVDGLWAATGFSGHGLAQAPEVGRLLAQWWLDGWPEIDLSPLTPARFTHAGAADLVAETVVF